nr:zinc ribbon domain-containing protein [Microbacterium trichothecenolyticum]
MHPDTAGFWESLRDGQLSLQRCRRCGVLRFPLSPHCHECLSGEYDWEPIAPEGTVAVAVRAHEAVSKLPASGVSLMQPWRGMTPYVTGAVDMDAGIRLPGRILCTCGDALAPGTPVTAVLLDAEDNATIYGFAHECVL